MAERLQITFRHMSASDSLRELAEEKLAKLQVRYPDILDCHVVVEVSPASRHRKGALCTTHVEVTLGRQHVRIAAVSSHAEAAAGMRDAFENIRRQIESRVERRAS
jgi:ribosomal subunit interface protein